MKVISSIFLLVFLFWSGQSFAAFTADDAKKLESEAAQTVARFQKETSGAETLLNNAKGILVCPEITKGGLIAGVEGGKCVLQVNGDTVGYYANRAVKFGLLAGVQWYSLILVFNQQAALDTFRTGEREFEVGVDASVAVAKIGAGGSLDTTNLQEAIVVFSFGQQGLMGDLSIEGATFKKLEIE